MLHYKQFSKNNIPKQFPVPSLVDGEVLFGIYGVNHMKKNNEGSTKNSEALVVTNLRVIKIEYQFKNGTYLSVSHSESLKEIKSITISRTHKRRYFHEMLLLCRPKEKNQKKNKFLSLMKKYVYLEMIFLLLSLIPGIGFIFNFLALIFVGFGLFLTTILGVDFLMNINKSSYICYSKKQTFGFFCCSTFNFFSLCCMTFTELFISAFFISALCLLCLGLILVFIAAIFLGLVKFEIFLLFFVFVVFVIFLIPFLIMIYVILRVCFVIPHVISCGFLYAPINWYPRVIEKLLHDITLSFNTLENSRKMEISLFSHQIEKIEKLLSIGVFGSKLLEDKYIQDIINEKYDENLYNEPKMDSNVMEMKNITSVKGNGKIRQENGDIFWKQK